MALASERTRLQGMAWARVGLALSALHFYATNFRNRDFFWGPSGMVPLDDSRTGFSFHRVTAESALELLLALGIVVALWLLLFGGRLAAAVHAILMISLMRRNPYLLDGGNNLERILLPMLVLTTNNAHLSLIARRVRLSLAERTRPSLAIIHNATVFLFVFQVATLYTVAGYWKLTGEVWREGTALYYIGSTREYDLGIPWMLLTNPITTTLLSYGVIAVQLSVAPAAISGRRFLRVASASGVIAMHLGIGIGMGLVGFAMTMIAADGALLRDGDLDAVRTSVVTRVRTIVRKGKRLGDDSRLVVGTEEAPS